MSMPTAPGQNPALDAETQVPVLVGISVAFLLASAIVVTMRLYTRYIIVKAPGIDDILMAVALVRGDLPSHPVTS